MEWEGSEYVDRVAKWLYRSRLYTVPAGLGSNQAVSSLLKISLGDLKYSHINAKHLCPNGKKYHILRREYIFI